MTRSRSLLDEARKDKNFTNGFDYLRVGLALAVAVVHCLTIAIENDRQLIWEAWYSPLVAAILPAFFALSGYLVAGSLVRNSIPNFLGLRVLRIVPALAFEIVLSAFIFGTLFTTLSYQDYFTSPDFYAYFFNIIGYIHYTLPGVFEGRVINAQLWTVPFELECYVVLVLIALVGLFKRRRLFLAVTAVACVVAALFSAYHNLIPPYQNFSGRVLVFAFLFGVLIYQFRDAIPYAATLAAACFLAFFVIFFFPNLSYLGTLPLAYVVVYVGLMRLPAIPFGDLSYGLYLFHFPVARALHEAADRTMPWWILVPLAIALSLGFAMISWRLIEEPILKRKTQILEAMANSFRAPRTARR